MGQPNLSRTEFQAFQTVSPAQASVVQKMAFTGYFNVGDTVDVADVDSLGNVTSWIAQGLTIVEVDPGVSVTLNSSVDTTTAIGTPQILCRTIDDGQSAVDRLFRALTATGDAFPLVQNVLAVDLNTPVGGHARYHVADIRFWKAGDAVALASNSGQSASGSVVATSAQANDTNNQSFIEVNFSFDSGTLTSPYLVNTSITDTQVMNRLQDELALIRAPIEAEFYGVGDGTTTAFKAVNLFEAGSTKLYLDGVRQRKGTAGTRGALTEGTGNAAVTFTSLILGLAGNRTQVASVAGAGSTVTVTGNWTSGYHVSVNNNSGAMTAAQMVAAVNADATASKIVQGTYGGTGASAVVAFALTSLTGGLDDGTGDYGEVEQVFNNQIANTGFQWLCLRIIPSDTNRLHKPPTNDEEITLDYRTILYTK